jgi:fibronectin-binding autotransporter adhesin
MSVVRSCELRRQSNRKMGVLLAAAAAAAGTALLLQSSPPAQAASLSWDPAISGGASLGGSGTWDTTTANWFSGTDVAWPNSGTDEAIFGGTTAGTVTPGTALNVGTVTFNTDGYTIATGNTLTLGGATPTVNVVAGPLGATVNAVLAGTTGLTLAGPGTLTLGGTNTFTGGLNINAGQLNYSVDGNLGAGGAAVSINGGTINFTGNAAYTDTRVWTIGSNGATINVANGGAAGGKISYNNANLFTGSGTITKTGPGWLSINGANNNATGNWTINSGVIEVNQALGASSNTVTVNGNGTTSPTASGEIAANGTVSNPITLSGGIIGGDNANRTFSGSINVTANSNVRLGDFYGGTNRAELSLTGPLIGSGNLTLINSLSGLPSGQILALTSNNANYTGTITLDPGHGVGFGSLASIPTNGIVVQKDTTIAEPTIAQLFAPGTGSPPIGTQITAAALGGIPAGTTGVFAVGSFSSSGTDSVDLSTLYGGGWFFGGTPNNVSWFGSIKPGTDASGQLYRLGGGGSSLGGGLFIGNAKLINFGGNVTRVQIGDTRIGGAGNVRYGAIMTYGGSTTVNAGSSLELSYNVFGSNGSNLMPTASSLIMNGGSFVMTGNKAGLTFSQTINGATFNRGAASIQVNTNATGNPMVMLLGGITRNAGGTVDFALPPNAQSATNGITTTTANANFAGGQQSILGGYATVGGNNWAVSAGTGAAAGNVTALSTYNAGFAAGTDVDAQTGTSSPSSMTINSLRFNSAGAYTVNDAGTTLTVATGGILETSTVGNNAVVVNSANLGSGNGQDLIVIQNNTSNSMTINSTLSGTNALTKSGNGTLVLGSANSYSGNTNINAGTLQLANAQALQNSTVNAGVFNGSLGFLSPLTAATIGGLTGNQYVNLNNTAGAAVALSVGNNNANTTYSGRMGGSGSLIKVGTGTFTLSSTTNNYTGTTTVNAGTLAVTGALNGNGAVSVSGGAALAGTGTVAGPVTLAAGSTAAGQGAVNLVDGNPGTLTLNGGLTVGDGSNPSLLAFDANATTSDQIALGTSAFNVNTGGAKIVINTGTSMVGSGTTFTLMNFGSGTGAGFATGDGTTVGGLTLADPTISFGVSGSLHVTSNQVQVVTSITAAPAQAWWSGVQGTHWTDTNAAQTNGNFTTDQAGTNFVHAYPTIGTDVFFAGNGATNLTDTLGADFGVHSLTFVAGTGAANIGGSNTLTVDAGGITVQSGAGAATISTSGVVLNASQTWTNNSSNTLTVTGNVSGTAGLTTAGNIVMSGTKTYTGNTTVSSGTLNLGGGSLTSPAGNLTVNGTLDLSGANVSVAQLSGSGAITNGAGAANGGTLTVNITADTSFTGPVTDAGAGKTLSIVKNGPNALTLSGANTYSGNTTLNAGSLIAGSSTAFGSSNLKLSAGTTVDLAAAGSGAGGAQSVTAGSIAGIGGTITDTNGNAGTTTLALTQSTNTGYAGAITDGASRPVAISKAGAGSLTIANAANNYSGGTTVSAGKLASPTPGTLGTGAVTLAGGTLSLGTVSNFGGNGTAWQINQVGAYSATPTPVTNDVLTLTDGGGDQGRMAFFTAPQTVVNASGFNASFVYTPGGNKAADGVAFVVQNDARGANISNGSGGSLGYTGTNNSGAVELNIFPGASGGVGTAFGTSANSIPGNSSVAPVVLDSGHPIKVDLSYQGTTLTEVLTDTNTNDTSTTTFTGVDFQTLLGGSLGYVGFTGATGGQNAVQTISNFSFETLAPTAWNNPVVASAGTSSNVEIGSPVTSVGPVTMNGGSSVSIAGASSLIANSGAYAVAVNGTTTLNGNAALNIANNGAGAASLTLADIASSAPATLTLGGTGSVAITGQIGASASIAANTTTTLTNVNRTFGGLSVGNGATVTQQAAATAVTPVVLNPATFGATGGGKLDLTDNELIAQGVSMDALNLVKNHGVVTSTAGLTLGYKDAGGGNYEIRATLLGDSDLDGQVNVADLANLAGNFGKTAGQFWINGDFDYNQNVNVADLADLAGNFGKDLASSGFGSSNAAASPAALAASPADAAVAGVSGAAVPEPTSLGLLGLGAIGLMTRRRRRRHHA